MRMMIGTPVPSPCRRSKRGPALFIQRDHLTINYGIVREISERPSSPRGSGRRTSFDCETKAEYCTRPYVQSLETVQLHLVPPLGISGSRSAPRQSIGSNDKGRDTNGNHGLCDMWGQISALLLFASSTRCQQSHRSCSLLNDCYVGETPAAKRTPFSFTPPRVAGPSIRFEPSAFFGKVFVECAA